MEHLNYHHLRLFWAVAREGHLTRASATVHLTPQTVSGQIRQLEKELETRLFDRVGRRLVLTERGRLVFEYAEGIFSAGRELVQSLRGHQAGRPMRLVVGVADVVPKLLAHRLIEPALRMAEPVRVMCREGSTEKLLAALALHKLDVVLSDGPIPRGVSVQAHNHLLVECGITFMGSPELAGRLRAGFPESLRDAPVLLPSHDAAIRRHLERWFDDRQLRPLITGEFEDSALLKAFGQKGVGFFAVPDVVREEVARQYGVQPIGTAQGLTEQFYAITAERRVRQPAVVAIHEASLPPQGRSK